MSASAQLDWLRLARSENVGAATHRSLIARYGSAANALEAIPDLATRGGLRRRIRLCSHEEAEREIDAGEKLGARLLTLDDADFPELLAAIDPPPPVLWSLGPAPTRLDCKALAVVGARNASSLGERFAAHFSQEAVAAGFTVVSGLARGVDAAAHRGALAAEQGRTDAPTAAVLAGGVDHIYPAQNEALYGAIRERGAIFSEAPIGLEPAARHFPRRNRLIAGLALGVLVVEAAERSGSLITARLATEQGREVMATPGHPFDPRAAGANALLREGATLVRHIDDALEALGPQLRAPLPPRQGSLLEDAPQAQPQQDVDAAREALLQRLSPSPIAIDDLFRSAGLEARDGAAALLELELAGLAEREPGGMVRRGAQE